MNITEKMAKLVELVGEAQKAYHGDFLMEEERKVVHTYQDMCVQASNASEEAQNEVGYVRDGLPEEFVEMQAEVERLEKKKTVYEAIRMSIHSIGRSPWQRGTEASYWNDLFNPLSARAEMLGSQGGVSETCREIWRDLEEAKMKVDNRSRRNTKVAAIRKANGQESVRLRNEAGKKVRDAILGTPAALALEKAAERAKEQAGGRRRVAMMDIRDRLERLLDTEVDGD